MEILGSLHNISCTFTIDLFLRKDAFEVWKKSFLFEILEIEQYSAGSKLRHWILIDSVKYKDFDLETKRSKYE